MTAQSSTAVEEISDRADFADALTQLRLAADLSVREAARRTGQRASTLGGWFGGQHLPQRSQRDVFMAVLRLCGVPDEAVEAWVDALERVRSATPAQAGRHGIEPYRGLLSYEPRDAEWFFGREVLTATILQRLSDVCSSASGVLAVVGPSGSGKSSLLRAGVIATLQASGIPDIDGRWRVELITPGTDPLDAWHTRGSTTWDEESGALIDSEDVAGTIVVVDQFEELFQPTVADADREEFLDQIFGASDPHAPRRTLVVLGMRADFYGAAVRYPQLAPIPFS